MQILSLIFNLFLIVLILENKELLNESQYHKMSMKSRIKIIERYIYVIEIIRDVINADCY